MSDYVMKRFKIRKIIVFCFIFIATGIVMFYFINHPLYHFESEFTEALGYIDKISQEKPSTEVYALLSGGGGEGWHQIIITINNGKASLENFRIYGDRIEGRSIKNLQDPELKELISFVQLNNADKMKHLYSNILDGTEYLYVHITNNKKSMVYMNNPRDAAKGTVYDLLVSKFELVAKLEN